MATATLPPIWAEVLGGRRTIDEVLDRLQELIELHAAAFKAAGVDDVSYLDAGPSYPADAARMNEELLTLVARCRMMPDAWLLFAAGFAFGDLMASGDDAAIRGKAVSRGRPATVSNLAIRAALERARAAAPYASDRVLDAAAAAELKVSPEVIRKRRKRHGI